MHLDAMPATVKQAAPMGLNQKDVSVLADAMRKIPPVKKPRSEIIMMGISGAVGLLTIVTLLLTLKDRKNKGAKK